jgi:hypothetical protein
MIWIINRINFERTLYVWFRFRESVVNEVLKVLFGETFLQALNTRTKATLEKSSGES